ncbi:hypothetical protein DXD68_23415 [Parabacteroides sp. TM07-1AC]|nr:hypothetical protein DXD68_23415 [Parabacteroides sp. TM07-1AC]
MNGDFRRVKPFFRFLRVRLAANLRNQAINREIRGIGRLFLHEKERIRFFVRSIEQYIII